MRLGKGSYLSLRGLETHCLKLSGKNLPGLLVVRNLYSEYHAHDARLEIAGPAAMRVIMDRADGELTFPVRRFVWL
jgi:hypothetical protein